MFSHRIAEVISYFIGVAISATIFFVAKQQKSLPEKKVFGFPLSNVAAALTVYFLAMAIWAYVK